MGISLKIIGIIVGLLVLVVGLPLLAAWMGLITLPFLKFESKVGAAQGIVKTTYNTNYCLQNYHYFKETYQDIQQKQTQISNFQAQIADFKTTYGSDPTKWGFTASQSYNETQSELTGVQNALAEEIGQYNARGQELDRVACENLPFNITP